MGDEIDVARAPCVSCCFVRKTLSRWRTSSSTSRAFRRSKRALHGGRLIEIGRLRRVRGEDAVHASLLTSERSHGNSRRPSRASSDVGADADDADHHDRGVDVGELLVARLLGDEPGDARAGADQLGDDEIGPRPAEQDALIAIEVGQDAGQHDAPQHLRVPRAQRQRRLDQRRRRACAWCWRSPAPAGRTCR